MVLCRVMCALVVVLIINTLLLLINIIICVGYTYNYSGMQ